MTFFNKKFPRQGLYHPYDLLETSARPKPPPSTIDTLQNNLNNLLGSDANKKKKTDVFKTLQLDPLIEYKNVTILKSYLSDFGMILPRRKTHLRAKTQKKLAKAIKRARAFGLLSYMSNYTTLDDDTK